MRGERGHQAEEKYLQGMPSLTLGATASKTCACGRSSWRPWKKISSWRWRTSGLSGGSGGKSDTQFTTLPEGVFQLPGDHTPQPPWEGLLQGARKESPAVSRTLEFKWSNVIFSWLWNTGPTLYPCVRVYRVYRCFVDLEQAYNCISQSVLWGAGAPGV